MRVYKSSRSFYFLFCFFCCCFNTTLLQHAVRLTRQMFTPVKKSLLEILSTIHWVMNFSIAANNERIYVLSYVSQDGETMKNIFNGHIKMNYSFGGHKHSTPL